MFDYKLTYGEKKFPIINHQGILSVLRYELVIAKEWVIFTILQNVGIAVLFAILIKITMSTNDLITINSELFSPLERIMPGLVLFSSVFNCFVSNGAGLLYTKMNRNFEDMLVAPLTTIEFVIAKLVFFLFYSFFVAVITYIVLIPFGIKLLPESIFPMMISLFLAVTFFTGLGLYCGLKMQKWDHFSIVETTLFPIIFFSGTVVPNSEFPDYLSKLNYYNPLTSVFDTFRSSWLGLPYQFNLALLSLIVLTSSFLVFALFVRDLNKRLSIT